ncbi:hypothetical protein KC360_g163 [Hortaea werneckii]|nr:hypothetical protein KC344_g165 [Hortaea werneckii]KAI7180411.1 hypothetical protein KC360_g163 [Hortaea werneckii]
MLSRSLATGRSTSSLLGSRRRTASSRSKGRLLATIINTPWSSIPSHSRRNWLIISRCVLRLPAPLLLPKIASASSMKTTQGESFLARLKTARTIFSPSPTYFSVLPVPEHRMRKPQASSVTGW